MKKRLTNPTTGVSRTKSALGKPKFKGGKNPLKGFKGVNKPALL